MGEAQLVLVEEHPASSPVQRLWTMAVEKAVDNGCGQRLWTTALAQTCLGSMVARSGGGQAQQPFIPASEQGLSGSML